jgi:hypothetical protein
MVNKWDAKIQHTLTLIFFYKKECKPIIQPTRNIDGSHGAAIEGSKKHQG